MGCWDGGGYANAAVLMVVSSRARTTALRSWRRSAGLLLDLRLKGEQGSSAGLRPR